MCKMAEHPNYYLAADYLLRKKRISREMPGYELLRRGIVNCKVEKGITSEKLLKNVIEGMVVPTKGLPKSESDVANQLMEEAIESCGEERSVYDFVKILAGQL